MKKLAVIGGKGTLGSDLIKYLGPFFSVVSITKDNYTEFKGCDFDAVINANGNSRRFWANQNPQDDFFASTVSVYRSIFDFTCGIYMYISSPDVYENHTNPNYTKEDQKIDPKKLSPYGFHKYLSELIVKKYKEKYLILRSAMILGTNLKKGPFYDVKHNKSLFITPDTKLQLITTKAIADIIKSLLKNFVQSDTLNIGGIGTLLFEKIGKYFEKEIKISPEAKAQVYEMNIEKIKHLYRALKTSEEYLEEFLRDCDL